MGARNKMDERFTEFTKKYVSTMLEVNPHLSEPSSIRDYLEFMKADEDDILKCEKHNSIVILRGYRNTCGVDWFVGISIEDVLTQVGDAK